jgi:hypothetical protein
VDFYTTTAQVIPVLLLALVWESGYLERVKKEDRSRYPVFKKSVVRWWGVFMITAALVGEATMLLVLAGVLDDGAVAKAWACSPSQPCWARWPSGSRSTSGRPRARMWHHSSAGRHVAPA